MYTCILVHVENKKQFLLALIISSSHPMANNHRICSKKMVRCLALVLSPRTHSSCSNNTMTTTMCRIYGYHSYLTLITIYYHHHPFPSTRIYHSTTILPSIVIYINCSRCSTGEDESSDAMRSEAVDDLLKSVDKRHSGEFSPQENQKNWDFTVKNRCCWAISRGKNKWCS